MGDWGASPSPVEQPVPDPVGEGSRRPGEEPREGGCGLGEARNGGRGGGPDRAWRPPCLSLQHGRNGENSTPQQAAG